MQKKSRYRLEERQKDFEIFTEDYKNYLDDMQHKELQKKEKSRYEDNLKQSKEAIEKYKADIKSAESMQQKLERQKIELRDKIRIFEGYCEDGAEKEFYQNMAQEDAGVLEARFEAITSKMSVQIQDLEAQEKRLGRRLGEACDRLAKMAERYGLEEIDWKDAAYNIAEETRQEKLLAEKRRRIEELNVNWNFEEKQAGIIDSRIDGLNKTITERFGKSEPLPKEEITIKDFEGEINKIAYQISVLEKEMHEAEDKLFSVGENLSSLAEYSDFEITKEPENKPDIGSMDNKELRDYKGIMLRDYRNFNKEQAQQRTRLERLLNQTARKPEYQDDMYRKPIENMIELADDAAQVQEQLEVILMAYRGQLEKLEVDIADIENERNQIRDLFADYVKDVHYNLARIDSNSTITVREKPIKMLRIELDSWDENENAYMLRLQDFMQELTVKAMEKYDCNENPQEYFGIRITTKNLYDLVVGINSVKIRLYKIEEQREYPITWADVAKNSGGEGFLSAFIILSSLLHYMRRDESDIFADRNEGKVLIMDNPFAQTNAAHLLKPLMDMAKKTNTQLICLSGIGGDSIYSRFDNIYILNPVTARLRNGIQYLRAEHTKGMELEKSSDMESSQIEVIGQQSLLF